jgi:hypothetical protein
MSGGAYGGVGLNALWIKAINSWRLMSFRGPFFGPRNRVAVHNPWRADALPADPSGKFPPLLSPKMPSAFGGTIGGRGIGRQWISTPRIVNGHAVPRAKNRSLE